MLHEPFFGHFFTSILKDVSKDTESVSLQPARYDMLKLIINENYWRSELTTPEADRTKDLRYGAIKHQILHLVLKHIMRTQDFGNRKLFNMASDIAANQYIMPRQLTEDAITLDKFPDFKLDRQQSIDYYYKRLHDELEGMDSEGGSENENDDEQQDDDLQQMLQQMMGGSSDESDDNDNNDDENQAESDSEQHEQQPPRQQQQKPLNESQKYLKQLMEQPEHTQLDQHKTWDEIARLSTAERKLLDSMINDAIASTMSRVRSKQNGTLPGDLQAYLDALLDSLQPNVNWRRVLRLFAATSSRTYIKSTIQRVSKRYGTAPGIKLKHRQKILVALDTSGSIFDEDLREFFAEIHHIWRNGAEIMIVECDADIQTNYLYKGTPPNIVSGRGGTDFNPPLRFANEEYHPDGIIYFTDGEAPAPEIHSRTPILWMITSNGIDESSWDFLLGRKVKMMKQL